MILEYKEDIPILQEPKALGWYDSTRPSLEEAINECKTLIAINHPGMVCRVYKKIDWRGNVLILALAVNPIIDKLFTHTTILWNSVTNP